MWYLATPHEVAPGEQPDYELRTTTSIDGRTDWTPPHVWSTAKEGFFDNAIIDTGSGWTMILARGTNLHGTIPFPEQGLWRCAAQTPSPQRSAWSPPVKVLDTDPATTPAFMGQGLCDPALARRPDGSLAVFATGTWRYRSWARLAASRLRQGHQIPVPAPFHLGAAVFTLNEPTPV